MRTIVGLIAVMTSGLIAAGCGEAATPASPSPPAAPVTLQTVVELPVHEPIADVTAGSVGTDNYPGQSVYVPWGVYSHLRFQWYTRTRQAAAFGKLYLLTQEFLGRPVDLPNATGIVAVTSVIEQGEFVFDPALQLSGAKTYWFYADAFGAYSTSFDIDTYSGGVGYVTGIWSQPFRRTQASGRMVNGQFVPAPPGVTTDANFRLRAAAR